MDRCAEFTLRSDFLRAVSGACFIGQRNSNYSADRLR